MVRYLQRWIDQLRWQRLPPFQRLAQMLADHLDGILNYCRTKVRFGVVEAINGNIETILRRGRGYKNLAYLLLKRSAWRSQKQNLSFFRKRLKMQAPPNSCAEPFFLSLHVRSSASCGRQIGSSFLTSFRTESSRFAMTPSDLIHVSRVC
jgi:Transposase